MKRFKRILCVAGPEESCVAALRRAVALAEANQASLKVVDVAPRVAAGIGMPDGGPTSGELQTTLIEERSKQLAATLEPFRTNLEIASQVLVGTPFLEIIREVLRANHDLVIKTPEDPDWLDRLFGSDDMHLLRKCPCPLWLVKCRPENAYRCILAAVDVGDECPAEELVVRKTMNTQILEMASSLALAEFAQLHVAHAWEAVGEGLLRLFGDQSEERITRYVDRVARQHQRNLDALLQDVRKHQGPDALDYLAPTTHLLRGSPRQQVPALAKRLGADLVVMGTVGRSGVAGLLIGNTAETILEQIDCSVLAIKPPGFRSVVTLDD